MFVRDCDALIKNAKVLVSAKLSLISDENWSIGQIHRKGKKV